MPGQFTLVGSVLPFGPVKLKVASPECIVGRSSQCHFVVPSPSISRRHARFKIAHGKISLEDLASTNGTFVDGQRLPEHKPVALLRGQAVQFGSVSFVLDPGTKTAADPDSGAVTKDLSEYASDCTVSRRQGLSAGQRRIFELMVQGLAEKKIASKLHLSPFTVHNHIRAIYQLCHVHSRGELLAMYVNGLSAREPSVTVKTAAAGQGTG